MEIYFIKKVRGTNILSLNNRFSIMMKYCGNQKKKIIVQFFENCVIIWLNSQTSDTLILTSYLHIGSAYKIRKVKIHIHQMF